MSKPALGRGLGALLGGPPSHAAPSASPQEVSSAATAESDRSREGILRVPLTSVTPCNFQPRKDFSDSALQELADSIREQGIVQPLIVRPQGNGYEIIAGERRWRAAQRVGLSEIPIIIRDTDDRGALELALIENLQRENLNPMEEAHGFARLIEQFHLTQEEAALKVGKSRAAVANAVRLLKLSQEVQLHIKEGRLSVGHAKVILGLTSLESQKLAADRVIRQTLNVRQTEALVSDLQTLPKTRPSSANAKAGAQPDPQLATITARLREHVGTRVDLRYRKGKGTLQIHFYTDDDLERVLGLLGVQLD